MRLFQTASQVRLNRTRSTTSDLRLLGATDDVHNQIVV